MIRRAGDLPPRLDKLPARTIPAAEIVLLDVSMAGGDSFSVSVYDNRFNRVVKSNFRKFLK